MASIEITADNFKEVYTNNDIVLLDFWAGWCAPCRAFAPNYEEASEKYLDVVFGKVDTESETKISEYFAIRSIPTVVVIREGLEIHRHSGTLSVQEVCQLVEQTKSLNMDDVRKRIEEEENESK